MHELPQANHSTTRLSLLALSLASIVAFGLSASNGFLKAWLANELPWHAPLLLLAGVAVGTATILCAFTASMRPSNRRTSSIIAAAALALTIALQLSQTFGSVPQNLFFWANLIGQSVFAYTFSQTLLDYVRVSHRLADVPVKIAATAVALTGSMGFIGQSWIALSQVTLIVYVVRDFALLGIPVAVLTACAWHPRLRLDPKSALASMRLRLPVGPDQRSRLLSFAITVAGLTASAVFTTILAITDHTGSAGATSLAVISWGWIGLGTLAAFELKQFSAEQRHGTVTESLASAQARRFVKRHLSGDHAWAATAGIKTTNFVIDHDPGNLLQAKLPASIMQIRSEEIQRCVTEVLGPMFLHSHVDGARITGAVDPETTLRPCIDTLSMFACLYLDAGPLVERRVRGLTALLPIVDPGLANIMRTKDVSSLIRRNLWLFHFDFGWIDQHVIHSQKQTRYDVRLAGLDFRMRHSIMEEFDKSGGIGNFLWLGHEARDRLLQEAPAMISIVDTRPLAVNHADSGESLMFAVKFEQLIPRLQRYFDLDSKRKNLLDFEPSQESVRLQNLLRLQIGKTRTREEALEILDSITSVQWRGFREKDNALQLVLTVYEQLGRMGLPENAFLTGNSGMWGDTQERLVDAVRAIGYPSQILHRAHIHKIELRDVNVLSQVAINVNHPRFAEAWLLLATTDYQRHTDEQRRFLFEFLTKVPDTHRLASDPLIQVKAIDAFASLSRAARSHEKPLTETLSNKIADWHARHRVDPDISCLFLDAQMFLSITSHGQLTMPMAAVALLDRHFQSLTTELGASHPKVISVISRWQEVRRDVHTQRDVA